jgi:hypothetical protein
LAGHHSAYHVNTVLYLVRLKIGRPSKLEQVVGTAGLGADTRELEAAEGLAVDQGSRDAASMKTASAFTTASLAVCPTDGWEGV